MHVKHSATGPPTLPSHACSQQVGQDQRRAGQKDLRADWFNRTEFTQSERGEVVCNPTSEDVTGNFEDRDFWDLDEARIRRIEQSLQQEKMENAKILADNRYQGSTTLMRSEKGERELRRALLGARAAARLEARLAMQHRLKKEAAERAMEGKKQAARAEILRALGEDEHHWLPSEVDEQNVEDNEARAKNPADAKRRHPRKMSADEKLAARKGVKRNKSRQMGLIAGEKRSWSKAKAGDTDGSNIDLPPSKESKGLRKEANTRLGGCSDKGNHGHIKHSEMQRLSLYGLRSSHTRMGRCRLMKVESMRDLPEEVVEDVVRLEFERPPKRFNPFECKIGTQNEATRQIKPVRPGNTSIENQNPRADEDFPEEMRVIASCYIMLWATVYSALSLHMSPLHSIATMATCTLRDFIIIWVNRHRLRHHGLLEMFAVDFVSSRIINYLAWIVSMSISGPAKATAVVWFMSSCTYAVGEILTHKWCQVLQKPTIECRLLAKKAEDVHPIRLESSEIDLTHVYLITLWQRMIEIAGYFLTYLALFSEDSYPSRILAITVAAFIRSEFYSMPPSVREGQPRDELIRRVSLFADETDYISLPSVIRYIIQGADIFRRWMEHLRVQFRRWAQAEWVACAEFFKPCMDYGVLMFNTIISAILLILSLRDKHLTIGLIAALALGVQVVVYQCVVQSPVRAKR